MMKRPFNVVIFGVGAMGCLFGSRLVEEYEFAPRKLRANVTLFGSWQAQIEAIREQGVLVTHPNGHQTRHWLNVTDDLSRVPQADVALILVKGSQTQRAARQARQILHAKGVAITLQNGLGNYDKLVRSVGKHRAAQGTTAQGATIVRPGHLHHAGQGPTHIGLVAGLETQLRQVSELFNQADLNTNLIDNADSLVWGKLAINAGINPLTALMDVPNGAVSEDGFLRQAMSAAVNEVVRVATAQGIRLPFTDPISRVIEVCRATAGNRSSMLQDISRHTPTEIDTISGAVVRFGQMFGIPTPVNELFVRLVKDKERSGRFDRTQLESLVAA